MSPKEYKGRYNSVNQARAVARFLGPFTSLGEVPISRMIAYNKNTNRINSRKLSPLKKKNNRVTNLLKRPTAPRRRLSPVSK